MLRLRLALAGLLLFGACSPSSEEPAPIEAARAGPSAAVAPALGPYQGALRVAPGTATVPAIGAVSLRALGGTGTGYAWSLLASGSGTLQQATGQRSLFTAGPVLGTTEAVVLKDSAGGAGVTASVVTASTAGTLDVSPVAAGALAGDSIQFTGGTRWSVTSSAGSTIDASGLYVAGPGYQVTAPSASDVVTATDGAGHAATATVEVWFPFRVVPGRFILSPGEVKTFTAQGQVGAVTWALTVDGSGATLSNGIYTAGALAGTRDTIRALDSTTGAMAEAIITVRTGLPLAASVPTLTLAPNEAVAMSASGGTGLDYAWTILENGSGTQFQGALGTPATFQAGGFGSPAGGPPTVDVVKLGDSSGDFTTLSFTITKALTITSAPAPQDLVVTGQTLVLAADGGKHPFTWSVVQGGSRPSLVSSDSTATYTAGDAAGTTDVIRVTDAVGTSKEVPISVRAPVKKAGGCGTAGGGAWPGLLAALLALRWRRAVRHLKGPPHR
jgi:hypothetical protein